MWQSLPEFGTGVLYAILVAAAYTFAVSLAAGRGRPRLLTAARLGAYGTCGLVLLGVLLLAYAFQAHDFRIRYVSHYSDRSMSWVYLLTSLWGGQDGSLLWWSLLLAVYTGACVAWLKGRYRELQPFIIATLMVIIAFFAILMLFSANPFETNIAGARPDGEGLNPLLQNYWMIIHPPALYTGFVGCAVPFAFCVAALVTGRLDNEWIVATRKWMLFGFMFLSIGNVLGMRWAYEELGWGGYWAWDPVENAACLPWFTAAAYVHSTMIQERRNMLKVWNVFLICFTFFLTIFGTFLTRSGIIASVHSFAQSEIGTYFLYFMGLIAGASAGLIIWRLPQLRAKAEIESVASREAMFVVNNWALLGAMTFIVTATMFPKLSELWHETVTVGPPFFNRWLAPIGIVIFALMGLAPLFGWRKTSEGALKQAFKWPGIAFVTAAVLHFAIGERFGYPAMVPRDPFYPGLVGVILQKIGSLAPVVVVSLAAFNVAVIVQEFQRGVSARRRSAEKRGEPEGVLGALFNLVAKNRRRYGGYIVHLGIVGMFIGFVGSAWNLEREVTLVPGQSHQIGNFDIKYLGTRMCPGNPKCSAEEQADLNKRMLFADFDVKENGKSLGQIHPAKFFFAKNPDGPTTEVSLLQSLRQDLYTVIGTVDPQSKRGTFRFHVNPLVMWIWLGGTVLVLGACISLWPELAFGELGAWAYVRAGAGVAAGTAFSLWLAMSPSYAYASMRPASTAPPASPMPRAEVPWSRSLPPLGATLLGLGVGAVFAARRKRPDGVRHSEPRV
ncbi:MAG TPA: cytochrome c-type biogenesis CcmF C-terminal domain-containing protein [Polyangiaceae bacterium]|nr:cytochrome c-type biogenesis CcmF C-terminal domain-containing protein [Polyangiaceae bacterium]